MKICKAHTLTLVSVPHGAEYVPETTDGLGHPHEEGVLQRTTRESIQTTCAYNWPRIRRQGLYFAVRTGGILCRPLWHRFLLCQQAHQIRCGHVTGCPARGAPLCFMVRSSREWLRYAPLTSDVGWRYPLGCFEGFHPAITTTWTRFRSPSTTCSSVDWVVLSMQSAWAGLWARARELRACGMFQNTARNGRLQRAGFALTRKFGSVVDGRGLVLVQPGRRPLG